MTGVRLTAAQTADVLGVRLSTVYAYVSRGVLQRTTHPTATGQRVSTFDRDEVLALAAARERPRAGVFTPLIESDVTELEPQGRLAFRGRDVAELAMLPFEDATAVLWDVAAPRPWPSPAPPVLERCATVTSGVTTPQDRIMLAVMTAASLDGARGDLDRERVLDVAREAVLVAVHAVGPGVGGPVAPMLWRALTGTQPSPAEHRALDAALVCLMDHELAASTVAARITAGTHADPWMCLVSGLATLRGPRHGGTSGPAVHLLRSWLETGRLVGLPYGFGHKVYEGVDPRADILLDHAAELAPHLVDAVEGLTVTVAREHGLLPNVDLGLAALAVAMDLPEGAPESIFMISRMAGFAAHVLEEYPHGLRYRPRAVGSTETSTG